MNVRVIVIVLKDPVSSFKAIPSVRTSVLLLGEKEKTTWEIESQWFCVKNKAILLCYCKYVLQLDLSNPYDL